jgi:hypothetical protein
MAATEWAGLRRRVTHDAQASGIARIASSYAPICHLIGDQKSKSNRVGVWVTKDIKEAMRRDLFTLLDTERISFSHDFASHSNGMKGAIGAQLRNYKFEFKPPKDAFGKVRMVLSGKSNNMSDDLCLVLQMLCFWGPVYYQHPRSVRDVDPITAAD